MSRFLVLVFISGCLILNSGWCTARPKEIPSTSLNLPIPDALERGDSVLAHISDTAKDYALVEPTYREMKIKELIHQAFIKVVNPKPIVDTIREEEKYGNNGDQLEGIGNAIVKGTEVSSQFIGQLASFPGTAIRTVSGKVTQALNGVGAHLIGL